MMNRKFLWIIAFVSSLMFNQMVFADSTICREGLNKMLQSINLDNDQKAKIKPILDQLKTNLKATSSQMNGLEDQITQQASSANMDQAKVNSLVDTKTKLIGDMMKARIAAKNQIFAILKPEQNAKLQDKIKKEDEKIASEFKNCDQD